MQQIDCKDTDHHKFDRSVVVNLQTIFLMLLLQVTARPRDTRILVQEKNRAAQNRASWGLYLCTKWDFFTKNRVSSRLLFKIRASWGYTYVLKEIFIDFFLAYLAIWSFFNWDLWTIGTFGQLGPSSNWEFGCLGNWDLWTIGDSWIILDQKDAQNKNKVWGFFRNLQGDWKHKIDNKFQLNSSASPRKYN